MRTVIYVLFTEGYLSSHAESTIRRELCDEAIRLAEELAEHQVGAMPETYALWDANEIAETPLGWLTRTLPSTVVLHAPASCLTL